MTIPDKKEIKKLETLLSSHLSTMPEEVAQGFLAYKRGYELLWEEMIAIKGYFEINPMAPFSVPNDEAPGHET